MSTANKSQRTARKVFAAVTATWDDCRYASRRIVEIQTAPAGRNHFGA